MILGEERFLAWNADEWVAIGTVGAFAVALLSLVVAIVRGNRASGRAGEADERARRAEARAERAAELAEANEERSQAAEQRAERTEERADEALAASQVMAESLQRMAARQAEPGGAPAPAPMVEWRLEYYRGDTWTLRNVGTREATGVTVTPPANPRGQLPRGRFPSGESVSAGHAIRLMLSGSLGNPLPTELLVSWDGHAEPVVLAVPPKRG